MKTSTEFSDFATSVLRVDSVL